MKFTKRPPVEPGQRHSPDIGPKSTMKDKVKTIFKSRLVILSLSLLPILFNLRFMFVMNADFAREFWDGPKEQKAREDPKGGYSRRPKIAVVSTFVQSDMWKGPKKSIEKSIDHILNRECYCYLWKYDCLFNQTREMGLYVEGGIRYDQNYAARNASKNPWWLKFAAWERVPHLQAALPNYDWVLYGDLDYIIKDMSRPIESFIKEFELYGKNDVHVLVPRDDNTRDNALAFSSFAVLIKNSPFGIRLLENWRAFGMGLCPNGNFRGKKQKYEWFHSDQAGLWYALMKTHNDFHNEMQPDNLLKLPAAVECNETTGLLNKNYWLDMKDYFYRDVGYRPGNYGADLKRIDDHQMIAWSTSKNDSMSGLGVDRNWFAGTERFAATAFALHIKKPSQNWDPEMQIELGMCKKIHGCFVTWNETNGLIRTGCGGNTTTPIQVADDERVE